MHQLGIVSAIIPEWKPCTARVQHDLYHVYTVDQHQLYAVEMQKRIARGELALEHPLATDLWTNDVKRPASLLLGTMLHDVGKPLGKGHAEKGAVVTKNVAARLGMSEADGELAEFLVRQHLTMSHLSQRRDLSDPEVIARFGERVADDEHLVQLYLVTLCDTAMTAPDNLTAWKDGLLRDLLLRTREHFRAGSPETATQAEAAAREKAIQIVERGDVRRCGAHRRRRHRSAAVRAADAAPGGAPGQARHGRAAQAAAGRHRGPLLPDEGPQRGHDRRAGCARRARRDRGRADRRRINVLGAVLGHIDFSDHRLVLDTFYVRDLKGEAITDDDPRWARLLGDLRELLAGEPDPAAVASLIAKRRPRSALPPRVTPGVPTEIRLHDDSTQATIVEVFTRDRAGVLYAITQTLADLGLDISLAKVSTEGEKVADVFYVTRAGKRLTDKARARCSSSGYAWPSRRRGSRGADDGARHPAGDRACRHAARRRFTLRGARGGSHDGRSRS